MGKRQTLKERFGRPEDTYKLTTAETPGVPHNSCFQQTRLAGDGVGLYQSMYSCLRANVQYWLRQEQGEWWAIFQQTEVQSWGSQDCTECVKKSWLLRHPAHCPDTIHQDQVEPTKTFTERSCWLFHHYPLFGRYSAPSEPQPLSPLGFSVVISALDSPLQHTQAFHHSFSEGQAASVSSWGLALSPAGVFYSIRALPAPAPPCWAAVPGTVRESEPPSYKQTHQLLMPHWRQQLPTPTVQWVH